MLQQLPSAHQEHLLCILFLSLQTLVESALAHKPEAAVQKIFLDARIQQSSISSFEESRATHFSSWHRLNALFTRVLH
jgi:hypothetical protein